MTQKFFINRRSGAERRIGDDKRQNPRLDLPHKRRRKSDDRRRDDGTVTEDFYALHGLEKEDFQPPRETH